MDDFDEETEVVELDEALAGLPEGPPTEREGYAEVKRRLTDEDKAAVKLLRTVAFDVARRNNGLYTVEGLRSLLVTQGRGKGLSWLFRFVVVHNHRIGGKDSKFRWRRTLPPHRGAKGTKCEVYKLDYSETRFEKGDCGCAWCAGR